jgi:hypothetical protein
MKIQWFHKRKTEHLMFFKYTVSPDAAFMSASLGKAERDGKKITEDH